MYQAIDDYAQGIVFEGWHRKEIRELAALKIVLMHQHKVLGSAKKD